MLTSNSEADLHLCYTFVLNEVIDHNTKHKTNFCHPFYILSFTYISSVSFAFKSRINLYCCYYLIISTSAFAIMSITHTHTHLALRLIFHPFVGSRSYTQPPTAVAYLSSAVFYAFYALFSFSKILLKSALKNVPFFVHRFVILKKTLLR